MERVFVRPDLDEQYQQDDCGCGPAVPGRRGDLRLGRHDGSVGSGGAAVGDLLLPDPEQDRGRHGRWGCEIVMRKLCKRFMRENEVEIWK